MSSLSNESMQGRSSLLNHEDRSLAIQWLMNVDGNTSASDDSRDFLTSLIHCCPTCAQTMPEVNDILYKIKFITANNTYDPTLAKTVRTYIENLSTIEPSTHIVLAKKA
ncbi:MAG: hypothetical protein Q8L98_03425 [Chlamydiales bacterium]|nr:hypothetical protein [Chlamydiales bacterium]